MLLQRRPAGIVSSYPCISARDLSAIDLLRLNASARGGPRKNRMAQEREDETMPTIEGKQAGIWINDYVKKARKFEGVAKAVRSLMKKEVKGVEEYVNPWNIPSFDSNGPLCCFMVGKFHVTFAFMRGASLTDPEKLLEGTGKGVRHVKLRNVADVKKPGVKNLVVEAATLNRKDPPSGMMVGMEKRKRKNN